MNVVIGTMVESIIAAAKSDRSILVRAEKTNKHEFLQNMTRIFRAVDADNSGGISEAELRAHMENPDVCAYFAALGVESHQVGTLFRLLDRDGSGDICLSEFLKGVLRLRGEAKSVDIAMLMHEIEEVHDHVDTVVKAVRQSLHLSATGDHRATEQVDESPLQQRRVQSVPFGEPVVVREARVHPYPPGVVDNHDIAQSRCP